MTRRTVSLTFLIPSLLIGVGQIRAGQTAFLVDNFANSSSLRAWQFSNGAEFPGASGSLSLGPGHTGAGATLNFKIRCAGDHQSCGHYVGAYRNISTPPNSEFHAVSLWASFPVGMRLVLRVEDETGQTLQYSANTPTLEHQQANAWSPVLISLDD
ncbi:MAG: hypothetical protein JO061_18095, partial [Acidobacteriaceae bacterium]|nr:hypothetical protein [Acidobacteriaceae bacterium]